MDGHARSKQNRSKEFALAPSFAVITERGVVAVVGASQVNGRCLTLGNMEKMEGERSVQTHGIRPHGWCIPRGDIIL